MNLPEHWQLYLASQWIDGTANEPVVNPWSGVAIARAPIADGAQLEKATYAALGMQSEFFGWPRFRKSELCQKIADGIAANSETFAQLITSESGKPIQYARGEVARAVMTFSLAAHEALRFCGEVLPLDIAAPGDKLTGYSRRVPAGVVAAISPFNFPLNLVAHKIAPAMAVGCPVILKPAPQTPLTALYLASIIHEAGAPPGAVSVLPMANEVAEQLVKDDRLGILSFTGSAKVGWHLKSIAGRKRVLLELGGNAPAIVHDDADIELAVDRLVPAAFAAAGQVCIKAQRLLVHQGVYNQFKEKFVTATRAVKSGDPADGSTVVGPLIDEKSAQRVMDWIDEAKALGAKVLCGGERDGALVTPTVLEDVPPDSKCAREEIFGPVVTLAAYGSLDEAISVANDTRYGLQAAIFTYDIRRIEQAASQLQYGGIIINDSPMLRMDNYPYGGMKDSGLGREGVRYAMEEYTQPKVIIQRNW